LFVYHKLAPFFYSKLPPQKEKKEQAKNVVIFWYIQNKFVPLHGKGFTNEY
jgi:hypothetical protein